MAESAVTSSVRRVLEDTAAIQSVIASHDGSWRGRLWSGIEEVGMNVAAAPESSGGAGLGLRESFDLLRVAGNLALEAPIADTMLANWMLGAAGLDTRAGKIAFGPSSFADAVSLKNDTVNASLKRLPFASDCKEAVLLAQARDGLSVVLVSLEAMACTTRFSLAGEPVCEFAPQPFKVLASAPAPAGFTAATTMLMGAAARSMLVAGALETLLSLTSEHVMQRRAFGRTISGFQAVQQLVARLASDVAVSVSAASSAAEAADSLLDSDASFDDPGLQLEIMSAKVRNAGAAQSACAIAHELFGAIGVTSEHPLHRLSLRALAWSDEFGNEVEWSRRLGALMCGRGAQAFWSLLATR
jgi:acyl-CoA dehydrogenase